MVNTPPSTSCIPSTVDEEDDASEARTSWKVNALAESLFCFTSTSHQGVTPAVDSLRHRNKFLSIRPACWNAFSGGYSLLERKAENAACRRCDGVACDLISDRKTLAVDC